MGRAQYLSPRTRAADNSPAPSPHPSPESLTRGAHPSGEPSSTSGDISVGRFGRIFRRLIASDLGRLRIPRLSLFNPHGGRPPSPLLSPCFAPPGCGNSSSESYGRRRAFL